MKRTYWAILNEPYGRAQDSVGYRIGRLVAFDSRSERDAWVDEAITDYISHRGSRDPLPARSPEVRHCQREQITYGPVADNPYALPERGYCPACGHPYYWVADEQVHDALACMDRTYGGTP